MNLFFDILGFVMFALFPFYLAFKMEIFGSYMIKIFPCTNADLILKYRAWKKVCKRDKTGRKYWMEKRNAMVRKRVLRSSLIALLFSAFSYSLYLSTSAIFLSLVIAYLILIYLTLFVSEIDRKFCLIPDLISFPAMIIAFLAIGLKDFYMGISSLEVLSNGNILMEGLLRSSAPSVLDSSLTALYAYFICTLVTVFAYKKYPDGFGGGDLKLLTFLGAFVGMYNFPILILLSVLYFGIGSFILKLRYLPYAPFALLSLLTMFVYNMII